MKKIVARMKDSTLEINGDETNTKGESIPDLSAWVSWSKTPDRHPWDTLRKAGWVHIHLPEDPKDGWLRWYKPETDEDRLHIECATYDWYYEMSDDARYYHAGIERDARIRDLFKKVPNAQAIWEGWVKVASLRYTHPDQFIEQFIDRFGDGK